MNQRMRICIIGCGLFARNFVPLFKAHPVVESVSVCDLHPERAADYAREFGVSVIPTFEDALADANINAVAIFTQRQTHGPLVIQALKAGKHVYSAVPCAVDVEDILEIERLVRQTRLTYSMGETGYYRAATCFCRNAFREGRFGQFVYGEAQYNHDIRNMERGFKSSGGDRWKEYAGIPPFFYPTHSTSMILGAMPGVYITHVSAQGYCPKARADIFGTDGQNIYHNPFGNTAMLARLSNGGVARISENRIVGWKAPETYISQFQGTDGSYEFAVGSHYFAEWDPDSERCEVGLPKNVKMHIVNDQLLPADVARDMRTDPDATAQQIADGRGFHETSAVQPTHTLPDEFAGLKNGHNGTHHFLIDDFCRAFETGLLSPTNIWQVARFNIPGLIAHQSALKGGVLMEVPDLGDAPADWPVLPDRALR